MADLRRQALVVEQQRGVREADRHLRHVLHLDEHVDRAIEVGDRGVLFDLRWPPLRSAGELAQLADTTGGAAQDEHVVGEHHLVAVGVDDPLLAAAHRDDAHAHFGGELDVGERTVRERRLAAHAHSVRDLFGGREVGNERGGDAETVRDDARDADRGRRHPLDGRHHVEHARHLLGVAR